MPPPSEEEGATRDTARITARLSLYKSGLGRHRSRRAHGEYCATIRTHFTRLRSGRLTGLMVVNFRDENFPLTPGGLKQEVTVHERLGSQRDGAPYWMKALMTLIIFFSRLQTRWTRRRPSGRGTWDAWQLWPVPCPVAHGSVLSPTNAIRLKRRRRFPVEDGAWAVVFFVGIEWTSHVSNNKRVPRNLIAVDFERQVLDASLFSPPSTNRFHNSSRLKGKLILMLIAYKLLN